MTSILRNTSFIILFLALFASAALGSAIKIPVVPKNHPRVYVRPNDLPEIKSKLKSFEFTAIWAVSERASTHFARHLSI
jgi:hypothetical protein